MSVFSKKSHHLPVVLGAAGPRLMGHTAAGRCYSGTVKEPGISISPVPYVMLLGFHSQSNSSIQNNCYRGKMCLITGSNALTMKAFQSIFLGQKKKINLNLMLFSSYALSCEKRGKGISIFVVLLHHQPVFSRETNSADRQVQWIPLAHALAGEGE